MTPPNETPPDDLVPSTDTIELVEERATVSKRRLVTSKVRIGTLTETFDETVEAELLGSAVVVEHVPIDKIVDWIPQTRTEDGVTIVPVFEEVLVVERRIRLIEELHIRHEETSETVRLPVSVRRQRAIVERLPVTEPTSPLNED